MAAGRRFRCPTPSMTASRSASLPTRVPPLRCSWTTSRWPSGRCPSHVRARSLYASPPRRRQSRRTLPFAAKCTSVSHCAASRFRPISAFRANPKNASHLAESDQCRARFVHRRRTAAGELRRSQDLLDYVTRHFADIRGELEAILPYKDLIPQYHEIDRNQTYISSTVDRDRAWRTYMLHAVGLPQRSLCLPVPAHRGAARQRAERRTAAHPREGSDLPVARRRGVHLRRQLGARGDRSELRPARDSRG